LCSSICFRATTVFRRDLWCRRRHNKLRSVLTNSAFGHWLPWYDVTYLGFRSLYPVGSFPSLVTMLPNVVGHIWQHSTLLTPSQALVDQRHCFYHCWKHQWRCLFGTVQYGQPLFGTVQYGQPLFVIPVAPCVRRQCSCCFIIGKIRESNQATDGTGSCFLAAKITEVWAGPLSRFVTQCVLRHRSRRFCRLFPSDVAKAAG